MAFFAALPAIGAAESTALSALGAGAIGWGMMHHDPSTVSSLDMSSFSHLPPLGPNPLPWHDTPEWGHVSIPSKIPPLTHSPVPHSDPPSWRPDLPSDTGKISIPSVPKPFVPAHDPHNVPGGYKPTQPNSSEMSSPPVKGPYPIPAPNKNPFPDPKPPNLPPKMALTSMPATSVGPLDQMHGSFQSIGNSKGFSSSLEVNIPAKVGGHDATVGAYTVGGGTYSQPHITGGGLTVSIPLDL